MTSEAQNHELSLASFAPRSTTARRVAPSTCLGADSRGLVFISLGLTHDYNGVLRTK